MRSARRISMKPAFRFCLGAALALVALVRSDVPARACAGGPEPVAVSLSNPDMPLVRFAAGDLGIVRPTFARSYLVVAYRYLAGLPLDPAEQTGALTLWARRLALVDAKYIDPTGRLARPPETTPAAVQVWLDARLLIPNAPGVQIQTDYYNPSDYSNVQNCLNDSFHAAATRLRALVTEVRPESDEVRAWLAAQDQVFANCDVAPQEDLRGWNGPRKPKTIPPALPTTAPARATMDRDYQIAAASLYGGDYKEAERRFVVVGGDKASPYRARARYLVARAIVRGAPASPDPPLEYRRALSVLDDVVLDPTCAQAHAGAIRYRTLVLSRLQADARIRETSIRLASQHVGSEMEDLLGDYTTLLDKDPSPVALNAPDADRLSAWIGVMKTPANGPAFERALQIYSKSRSPVWLVAALVSAENARDPRLSPLLDAVSGVPASAPAYPTLILEWVRLSRGRGVSEADVFARLQRARGAVPDATASTKNAFVLAAARSSPTIADFVSNSAVVPAGNVEGTGATIPDPGATPTIPDDVAHLMQRLPLASWREAALSPALPASVRGDVTAAAWVRAILLGDLAAAHAVAPAAEATNPSLAPAIAGVDVATTPLERRLAFLAALLHAPKLGPDVEAWRIVPTALAAIESSSAGYLWCKVSATDASQAAFLSPDDRARAATETTALSALGSGATFVATEAVALATTAPQDPRVPELLHLAVRMTRFGCKDEKNLEASRRAFEVLHARYPGSTWAKRTPYYFGGG